MSRARRAIGLAVAATVSLAVLCTGASAGPSAPLGHSGRWITDGKGRVVILHGVNMVYKRPPYFPAATGFGEDDAAFLQRHGFNTVRLGVIYAGLEPSPGSYDNGYLDQIAATESILARHGIFSLLDFHQDMYNERFQGEGWPDWAVQDDGLPNQPQLGFPTNYFGMPALLRAYDHFWANDQGPGGVGLQDRYAAAWGHAAARFASADRTLGLDLMNEPWPGTPWTSCFTATGCQDFDRNLMGPFYRRVIDRVRAVERQKLVWYEPHVLFNFAADTSIPDFEDPAAGFSFHLYCTQGLAPPPYTGSNCETLDEAVLSNAEKRAQATGDALLLSEFGATDDLEAIRRNVELADRHLVSWQYWHYCECLDPTTTGSGVQAIVVDPSQPPTGSNVKREKLDLLSQPYPQVVAGTPRGFDFNDQTELQVSYSTRGPSGRAFTGKLKGRRARKPGSRGRTARRRANQGPLISRSPKSVIFIGADRYPGGYRVAVDGGGIASKKNASRLKVVACPGRSDVSLTVRPAARGRNHTDCKVAGKRKKHRGGRR